VSADVRGMIAAAGAAQTAWAGLPLRARLAVLRKFRELLAERSDVLVDAMGHLPRTRAELLTSEVVPLGAAVKFLEKKAAAILGEKRLGWLGRPFWVGATRSTVRRVALGRVMIIGPSNYPLFLTGVQAVQALAAGNAIVLKPGRGALAVTQGLVQLLAEAGVDPRLMVVTDESVEAVGTASDAGVEKVFLTGSYTAGQDVLALCAQRCVPAVVELSGCDAVIVDHTADMTLAVQAIAWGLMLNAGQTCIGPRRVIVDEAIAERFTGLLLEKLRKQAPVVIGESTREKIDGLVKQALLKGARLLTGSTHEAQDFAPVVLGGVTPAMGIANADVFAPVLCVMTASSQAQQIAWANQCEYQLGAAVFASNERAVDIARQLKAGTVVTNDLIAPTADPRLTFGGSGKSGFGLTRGPEGLLEMTRVQTVIERTGKFRPHLDGTAPSDEAMFKQYLKAAHASCSLARIRAAAGFIKLAAKRGQSTDKRGHS